MTLQRETAGIRSDDGAEDGAGSALSGLSWPGIDFDRARVLELGVPAYCLTPGGELWEFGEGGFTVTGHGERRHADEQDAPPEGWAHPEDCTCPVCRVASR